VAPAALPGDPGGSLLPAHELRLSLSHSSIIHSRSDRSHLAWSVRAQRLLSLVAATDAFDEVRSMVLESSAKRRPSPGSPASSDRDLCLATLLDELRAIRAIIDDLGALVRGQAKSHYTVEEVARATGRSPYTVRRWIGDGRLIAKRIQGTGPHGKLLIAREDFAALLGQGLGGQMTAQIVGAGSASVSQPIQSDPAARRVPAPEKGGSGREDRP
jgi:hypothetical protein